MKKIGLFVAALFMMTSMTGCDPECIVSGPDYIVDWAPVNLFLTVRSADGTDLLDPDNPDNLIDGTSITFKGETYEASRLWYETGILHYEQCSDTKAYLARLYGLYLVGRDKLGVGPEGYSLMFGEIDGARDMDEDLVVKLPDGTTGSIHYHCSDHHEGRYPKCKRYWKFKGDKTTDNVFEFVVK